MRDKNSGHHNARARGRKKRGVDDDLVRKVVLSYYLHNGLPSCGPIRRVARELGISAELASACLDRGHKDGICTAFVNLPYEVSQKHILSARLREKYGLKQVILVPGFPGMLRELSQDERRRIHSTVIRAMVPQAAALLDVIVDAAAQRNADCRVSVAWGRSLRLFADCLEESPRPVRWARTEVLPLLGPTLWAKTDPVEASIIARRVAGAYGGSWGQLPYPAYVHAKDYDAWLAHDEVKNAISRLLESHCVFTSLGPIPPASALVDVTLSRDPAMSDTLASAARRAGAIGEINYWAFGPNGEPVETAYRAIGIGLDGLQSLSADEERSVVLMCGGDRHRIPALKGALAAKLCNILVSDTVTSRELLGEAQPAEEILYPPPKAVA